jgi:type II secretory pathway pseudopilin PulG
MKDRDQGPGIRDRGETEQGFMLLGLIVATFLILLTLSAAALVVARSLRRDRDVEAMHRGNQYVRAIQLYYKKFGHYPGSIDQLEKTNNIRFLRQRYDDPITGKNDWRTIPVGQNKTTVKWFFGEPLAGIASTGLGGAPPATSSPGISSGASGNSSTVGGPGGAIGPGGSTGTPGSASTLGAAGTTGTAGSPGSPGASGNSNTEPIGSQPTTSSGSGLAFMGVGLDAPGNSIVELNEQTSYGTWEFLYDPRVDQMKAKALAQNGGGLGSTPAGALGQTPAAGTGAPGAAGTTGAPGATTPGGTPPPGTTTPQAQP